MVHYRKKPYKRKQVYEEDQSTSVGLFDDDGEQDLFDEINDDSLLLNDEPLLFNEPDIVRQLRQEELEGKLTYPVFEDMEPFEQKESYEKLVLPAHEPASVKNYSEALSLARKALQEVDNKEKDIY
jgi:hypothetical protein